MTLTERFWSRVAKADHGCWYWLGSLGSKGYGAISEGRRGAVRTVAAHRYAYELFIGPIPDDLELDHLCRNTDCVRPDHLEPVTHAENMRRGAAGEVQARKTHCPRGHAYDEANTIRYHGSRGCRSCARERTRRWRAAQR